MDPIRVNYEEFPYKMNIGKNKIPKRLTPLTKFSQNKIRLADFIFSGRIFLVPYNQDKL